MKRTQSKRLAAALCGALLAGCLAGCGPSTAAWTGGTPQTAACSPEVTALSLEAFSGNGEGPRVGALPAL